MRVSDPSERRGAERSRRRRVPTQHRAEWLLVEARCRAESRHGRHGGALRWIAARRLVRVAPLLVDALPPELGVARVREWR